MLLHHPSTGKFVDVKGVHAKVLKARGYLPVDDPAAALPDPSAASASLAVPPMETEDSHTELSSQTPNQLADDPATDGESDTDVESNGDVGSDTDSKPDDESDVLEPARPKSNASRSTWFEYAQTAGFVISDGMTRADIIAIVEG